MQAKKPVSARSCKHLREVLGDAYEDARLKQAETLLPDDQKSEPPKEKEKPKSKGKAATKPKSKAEGAATKPTRASKRKREAEEDEAEEKEEENNDEEPPAPVKEPETTVDEPQPQAEATGASDDILAEINGIKPLKYLADGEETEAKSHTRYALLLSSLQPLVDVSQFFSVQNQTDMGSLLLHMSCLEKSSSHTHECTYLQASENCPWRSV